MPDFPIAINIQTPSGILASDHRSFDGWGILMQMQSSAVLTNAWGTALRTQYMPVCVTREITVTKVIWHNGATVAGNVDVGIYDVYGNKIQGLGSTAQSGTSTTQITAFTSTTLKPANYFLAFVSDSTTATFMTMTLGTLIKRGIGICEETLGALPLPTTATLGNPTLTFMPFLGFGILPAGTL